MSTTPDTNTPTTPLDLTPLLALVDVAGPLEQRLRVADATAVPEARKLVAAVEAVAEAFTTAVEGRLGAPLDFVGLQAGDVVVLCESIAGTGNLRPMLELAEELTSYGATDNELAAAARRRAEAGR